VENAAAASLVLVRIIVHRVIILPFGDDFIDEHGKYNQEDLNPKRKMRGEAN
jgi:hypothetical protein